MACIKRKGKIFSKQIADGHRLFTLWRTKKGIGLYSVYLQTHGEGESNDILVYNGTRNDCMRYISRHIEGEGRNDNGFFS